jgi:hypothetical protein
MKDADRAALLQNGLIAKSTGTSFDGGDATYSELRRHFMNRVDTKDKLPHFVVRCGDISQF